MIKHFAKDTWENDMDIISEEQYNKLVKNHDNGISASAQVPLVYLFAPDLHFQWLITEIDPQTNKAYGLIDVDDKNPSLEEIDLNSIQKLRDNGHSIYNSSLFMTEYTIAVFEAFAKEQGIIIAMEEGLEDDFTRIKDKLENLG